MSATMIGPGGSGRAGRAEIGRSRAGTGRGEKALLVAVLLLVGGVLGYAGFRVVAVPAEADLPEGDIAVVSKGEPIDLAAHAVGGKYTIYDFYADWCPPCRVLDVELHELAARNENIAVRKIDIIDWTTPVVAQHGLIELPYLVLYGPDGKELASGDEVYLKLAELFDARL